MLLLQAVQHHQWTHHSAAELHDKRKRKITPHDSTNFTSSFESQVQAFELTKTESDIFAVQKRWGGEAAEDKQRLVLLVHF